MDGERLDKTIARLVPAVSRSYLKKLVKDGYCTVNGERAEPRDNVRAGDTIRITLTHPIELPCRPVPGPLDVRYEDEHVLVVDKPAGVVCHPAKGHHWDTLLNWVVAHLLPEIQRGWARPHILGRLDKYTSGLVLISKTPQAHRKLQRQMDSRQVQRRYFALVWGAVKPRQGIIDQPIGEMPGRPGVMEVRDDGREAVTEYRVTRVFRLPAGSAGPGCPDAVSAVHARLRTGRTHQVRVHFAAIGHPVLGDDMYGPLSWQKPRAAELAEALAGMGGYALHAAALSFAHPVKDRTVHVRAALPDRLLRVLELLARYDAGGRRGE